MGIYSYLGNKYLVHTIYNNEMGNKLQIKT